MTRLTLALLATFLTAALAAAGCGGDAPVDSTAPPPEMPEMPAMTPAEAPPAETAPDAEAAGEEGEEGDQAQVTERPRLVAPVRGEANLGYLQPETTTEGNEVLTVFQVKNLSNGAIARLQIDEFWWDRDNNPVGGDRQFLRQPLQPGETAEITLRTRRDARMFRNSYQFSHANGSVRTTVLQTLD